MLKERSKVQSLGWWFCSDTFFFRSENSWKNVFFPEKMNKWFWTDALLNKWFWSDEVAGLDPPALLRWEGGREPGGAFWPGGSITAVRSDRTASAISGPSRPAGLSRPRPSSAGMPNSIFFLYFLFFCHDNSNAIKKYNIPIHLCYYDLESSIFWILLMIWVHFTMT